jgi:hypothetical protein
MVDLAARRHPHRCVWGSSAERARLATLSANPPRGHSLRRCLHGIPDSGVTVIDYRFPSYRELRYYSRYGFVPFRSPGSKAVLISIRQAPPQRARCRHPTTRNRRSACASIQTARLNNDRRPHWRDTEECIIIRPCNLRSSAEEGVSVGSWAQRSRRRSHRSARRRAFCSAARLPSRRAVRAQPWCHDRRYRPDLLCAARGRLVAGGSGSAGDRGRPGAGG